MRNEKKIHACIYTYVSSLQEKAFLKKYTQILHITEKCSFFRIQILSTKCSCSYLWNATTARSTVIAWILNFLTVQSFRNLLLIVFTNEVLVTFNCLRALFNKFFNTRLTTELGNLLNDWLDWLITTNHRATYLQWTFNKDGSIAKQDHSLGRQ